MNSTLLNRILLVLGYGGMFIAGVLSLADMLNKDVPCGVDSGCAKVAHDPSAHMLGVPNAYLGFCAYAVLAGFATYREFVGNGGRFPRLSITAGYVIAALGTMASIVLTFISITQIHATCKWCLASAATMTLTLLTYMALALRPESESTRPKGMVGPVFSAVLAVACLLGMAGMTKAFTTPMSETSPYSAEDLTKLLGPDAHVRNPNGVVTLVEFGDLDCPMCRKTFPQVEQLVDNSNGKLRYVFHNLPLYKNPEHVGALPGAVVAEMAAEKGKFYDYLSMVYGAQQSDEAPVATAADMINFGVRIGLDADTVKKRLVNENDPAFLRVKHDLDLARAYAVNVTPYFKVIVPGKETVSVAGSGVFDVLEQPEYKKLLQGP